MQLTCTRCGNPLEALATEQSTLIVCPKCSQVVQVPHDGRPILLMADRQTAGGYPTVGTVISADLGLAGQLGPGDTITFAVCGASEALAALVAQERALLAVTAAR